MLETVAGTIGLLVAYRLDLNREGSPVKKRIVNYSVLVLMAYGAFLIAEIM